MEETEKSSLRVVLCGLITTIICVILLCIFNPAINKSALFNKATEEDYKQLLEYAKTIAENYDVNSVEDENITDKDLEESDNTIVVTIQTYNAIIEVTFFRITTVEEIDGAKSISQFVDINNPVSIKETDTVGKASAKIYLTAFAGLFGFLFLFFLIEFAIDEIKEKKQ